MQDHFKVLIKRAPQWNAYFVAMTGPYAAAMAALENARAKGWDGYLTNENVAANVSMVAKMAVI